MALTYASLVQAVQDEELALIRVTATYQPGGGPGAKVFPPTFPTSAADPSPYLIERRTRGEEAVDAVVLDQVPSQANRAEEGLNQAWLNGEVTVPMLRLTHNGAANAVITGLTAPHRVFDAYWRDSELDGMKFDKTEMGTALQAASLEDASALLRHDPASLVYGTWNSHRKGRQAKFPRVYSSELVGWNPEVGTRKAGRMDPNNLTGARKGDGEDWAFAASDAKTKNAKLSEIGHGNIAPNPAHGGVTITSATRFATLSLTGLQRIRFGAASKEAQVAARAYLAALALLGDRLAFGGAGLWLRSGCDLIVDHEEMAFVGRGGRVDTFELSRAEAAVLYSEALHAAEAAGLALALETVELTPTAALAKALDFSLTKADLAGE